MESIEHLSFQGLNDSHLWVSKTINNEFGCLLLMTVTFCLLLLYAMQSFIAMDKLFSIERAN